MLFVPNYICRQEIARESEHELGKQEECLSWTRPTQEMEIGQGNRDTFCLCYFGVPRFSKNSVWDTHATGASNLESLRTG